MALEIKYTIPQLTEAITGGLIKVSGDVIVSDELVLVKKGRVDVPSSGDVVYSVAGTGVSLGDNVNVNIKNYDGSNALTAGVSDIWLQVTDDGVAPPLGREFLVFDDVETFVEFDSLEVDFRTDDFTCKFTTTDLLDAEGTLLSQNLQSTISQRDFQIYKFADETTLFMVLAGTSTELVGVPANGTHEYAITVTGTNVTVTRAGVEVFNDTCLRGTASPDPLATFKVGCRANDSNSSPSFVHNNIICNVEFDGLINAKLDDGAGNSSAINTGSTGNGTYRNVVTGDWVRGELVTYTGTEIDTVVAFGASIMNRSFTDTTDTEEKYMNRGVTVTAYNRATSGDDTTDMLPKLANLITEFGANASKTLVNFHGGGNNVSFDGPYPGGATAMNSDMRAMTADLQAAGFLVALSDITYRIPPASNDSDPYNLNVIDAIVSDTSLVDIPLALNALTKDNQHIWFDDDGGDGDGIHPDTIGKEMTRQNIVDTTVPFLARTELVLE